MEHSEVVEITLRTTRGSSRDCLGLGPMQFALDEPLGSRTVRVNGEPVEVIRWADG